MTAVATPARWPGADRPVGRALLLGAGLVAIWLALDLRTADLAAQVYRSDLFAAEGFALWDNAWFGGHAMPGYSLLFPALGALAGPRTVGACAALLSIALFTHLLRRHAPAHVTGASAWFAVAAVGDLFIGRLTFALGVALALAAFVAWSHGRPWPTLLLACAAAAASPVVGLFVALCAVAAVGDLGRAGSARLGGGALATAVAMALVFPEGGAQPYDLAAAAFGLVVTALAALGVDPRATAVRRGALLYLAAIVLSFVLPTPMGSNVARLGVLLAGPLLLCTARADRRALVLVACVGIGLWQAWGPVTEATKASDNPATSAAYFDPLMRYLASAGAQRGRVEVVPTLTRWESAFVARRFALARGWETQLDRRYGALFYAPRLSPEAYRRWLVRNGVRYVALPDVPLDRWSRTEAAVIRSRPAWLEPVWSGAHWRVFAVAPAPALTAGPAALRALLPDGFRLASAGRGRTVVRVRWTPYWHATGPGCVVPAPGGWTSVWASGPGTIRVTARWSLRGALGEAASCVAAQDRRGARNPDVAGTTR